MFLKELISQGWQALLRDRMRSALTMLGIVWGLASVVLLLGALSGASSLVMLDENCAQIPAISSARRFPAGVRA